MELHVFQVDAFTTRLFAGNPAGVVLNADGLGEAHMQAIARELNNSETAFILNRPGEGYDIEVRFFTPRQEVPICGHATIAAHYVYAREHGLRQGRLIQKTGAGKLPVEIVPEDGDLRIVMTQAGVEFGRMFTPEEQQVLVEGLGIAPQELDRPLPVQIVSTGHSKVMVPIKHKTVLDGIAMRGEVLSRLSGQIGCNGFYAFTFDAQEPGVLVSGRMFAPAIGINEDPVTGNANGPLGAYLAHYGRLEQRAEGNTFTITQGEAMGRKGYMQVHVYSPRNGPVRVKISGRARIVFQTTITVD